MATLHEGTTAGGSPVVTLKNLKEYLEQIGWEGGGGGEGGSSDKLTLNELTFEEYISGSGITNLDQLRFKDVGLYLTKGGITATNANIYGTFTPDANMTKAYWDKTNVKLNPNLPTKSPLMDSGILFIINNSNLESSNSLQLRFYHFGTELWYILPPQSSDGKFASKAWKVSKELSLEYGNMAVATTQIDKLYTDKLDKSQNLKDLTNITTAKANLQIQISSTLGTSTAIFASQKMVNDVNTKTVTNASDLKALEGKLGTTDGKVADLINNKVDKSSVVSVTGTSTTNVASQRLVNDVKNSTKRTYLEDSGEYLVSDTNDMDTKIAGSYGLYGVNVKNTPGAGFVAIRTEKLYTNNRSVQYGYGYATPRYYMRVNTDNADTTKWSKWAEFYSDFNTTDVKGFVRATGSLTPFTTDQIVQVTGTSTSNAMSQKAVSDELNKKLSIGDYGVGGPSILPPTGINDFQKLPRINAIYTIANSWTNGPYGVDAKTYVGQLEVIYRIYATSGADTIMKYYQGGAIWVLESTSGVWGEWVKISDENDIRKSLIPIEEWGVVSSGAVVLKTGEKLNSITTTGFRRNTSSNNATPENNYPIKNSGLLFTHATSTNKTTGMDFYHAYNSNRHFLRTSITEGVYIGGGDGWTELLSTNIHLSQTTGSDAEKVMSQKIITDELSKKITGGTVVQATGTSTINVMSQDIITKILGTKVEDMGTLGTTDLNTLNTASKCGFYDQTANANATVARNYPDGAQLAGTLIVTKAAGIVQIYITYSGGQKIWTRNYYSSSWSKWERKLQLGDVTSLLGISTESVASQKLVTDVNDRVTSVETKANNALVKSENLKDLANVTTARTNLGLGTSAIRNLTTVQGTSATLMATQKLVNDVKIELNDLKRDKTDFVFDGMITTKGTAYNTGITIARTEADQLTEFQLFPVKENLVMSAYDRGKSGSGWKYQVRFPIKAGTLALQGDVDTELGKKANNTVNIVAGNGLTGGGVISANRTITLGTPTEVSTSSTNSVATSGHTHALSTAVKASLTKADNAIPSSARVQSTGTSTTNVMSQKAVTDAIGILDAKKADKTDLDNVTSGYFSRKWREEVRTNNTEYTNTHPYPINLKVLCSSTTNGSITVDGIAIDWYYSPNTSHRGSMSATVSPNSVYKIVANGKTFILY